MKVLETLIHRPVVAIVLNLLLVVGGFLALQKLGIRQYPNIDQPVVTISTTYIGANPKLIERMITTPIEDKLPGIEGVKYFSSISVMNQSVITVTFDLDADITAGVGEVRNRVNQAREYFPDDAKPPIVSHESGGKPIMYIALTSDEWDVLKLTEYYNVALKTQMESVEGVQEMENFGMDYAMRLWIDPEKLAARQLTPLDIVNAVNQQNIDLPGGILENKYREYQILSKTSLNTPEQFNDLIIAYRDGFPIRFKDVGVAKLAGQYVPPENSLLVNGRTTLGLAAKIYEDADAIAVAKRLRAIMGKIQKTLPSDLKLKVLYDTTLFVEDSIHEVVQTIAEAVFLVILVVSLFLWSPRAISIPAITIPLSLCGAMAMMYLMGFTINLMSLLALVLAIGLVVDDGIVVLENTYRHIEGGLAPMEASVRGIREIMFPLISTTLTLAIVYVPCGFMSGQTGELFRQFAFTLAGTVIVSGYIALTLSPMMCAKILRKPKKSKPPGGDWITRHYRKILPVVLNRAKFIVVAAAVAVAVGAYFIFTSMKNDLMPVEDVNVLNIFFQAPEGSNFNHMKTCADQIDEMIQEEVPEAVCRISVVGYPQANQGVAIITLKPKGERKRTQQEIVKSLMGPAMAIPGAFAVPLNPPPPCIGGASSQNVNFVISTPTGGYEDLENAIGELFENPLTLKRLQSPQLDLDLYVQSFDVTPNRDLSAAGDVSAQDVAMNLAASLAPYRVTTIKKEGRNYDVYVQMPTLDRKVPSAIDLLYVRNNQTNDLIPMPALVDVDPTVGPIELNHFMGQRSVTIDANVAEGSALGETLSYLTNFTKKNFPDMVPQTTGYSRTFEESAGQFAPMFIMALVVVYLVLSAMFNSFLDPFIILLTVPLSMFGALALLKFTGGTINLYSQIGLVTLVGLIAKNGILIVDFANNLRKEGKSVREAIEEAAALRLRPILMTTGAMVLGAVPLAITTGAGSETRHPLGWVIIGGLSFGTLLTLFVIPTVYSLLAPLEKKEPTPE